MSLGTTERSKRSQFLDTIGSVATVAEFARAHAERAAQLAAELKRVDIGFADCQIGATGLVDSAELLTFNRHHFPRVPGLRLARV